MKTSPDEPLPWQGPADQLPAWPATLYSSSSEQLNPVCIHEALGAIVLRTDTDEPTAESR